MAIHPHVHLFYIQSLILISLGKEKVLQNSLTPEEKMDLTSVLHIIT